MTRGQTGGSPQGLVGTLVTNVGVGILTAVVMRVVDAAVVTPTSLGISFGASLLAAACGWFVLRQARLAKSTRQLMCVALGICAFVAAMLVGGRTVRFTPVSVTDLDPPPSSSVRYARKAEGWASVTVTGRVSGMDHERQEIMLFVWPDGTPGWFPQAGSNGVVTRLADGRFEGQVQIGSMRSPATPGQRFKYAVAVLNTSAARELRGQAERIPDYSTTLDALGGESIVEIVEDVRLQPP